MASRASIAGHPIHPMLVTIPIGLFVFSLVGDIAVWLGHDAAWPEVAFYCMGGGIVGALLAAVFGLVDLIALRDDKPTFRTGLTHMEWCRRRDGSIAISEVAARPPGAQFTTLMSYAHDKDMYQAWVELMVFDRFTVPERKYSAGAAYLRGFVEAVKASGFVAQAIARNNAQGVSVAPPAPQ